MSEELVKEPEEVEEPVPGTGGEVEEAKIVEEPPGPEVPLRQPYNEDPRFKEVIAQKNAELERANRFQDMAQQAVEALHHANEARDATAREAPAPVREEKPLFGEEVPGEEISPRVREVAERQQAEILALRAEIAAQRADFDRLGGDVYDGAYRGALERVATKLGLSVDTIKDKVYATAQRLGIPPSELEDAAQIAYGDMNDIKRRYAPKDPPHREAGTKGGRRTSPRISKADYAALSRDEQDAYDEKHFNDTMAEIRAR